MDNDRLIWFDAATPKYAIFYAKMIPLFQGQGYRVIVTTRHNPGYTEPVSVLNKLGVEHIVVGAHGGQTVREKFFSRLNRQKEFVEIFERAGYPDGLVTGCVPDSTQTAFGLGIPAFLLSDTPVRDCRFSYENITLVSRLSIPLASLLFHPFNIPSDLFTRLGVAPDKIVPYDFIDIYLWMSEMQPVEGKDFRRKYGLDLHKPTILIREEEYKAHYVFERRTVIYELIPRLAREIDANLVILPRYETEYLKNEFGHCALVLEEKLLPDEFYPFIDLLVGGGGTMNLEAACYGLPVISTRSLWLHHDKYLLDNNLMVWVDDVQAGLDQVRKLLGQKKDNKSFFMKEGGSICQITDRVHKFLTSRGGTHG